MQLHPSTIFYHFGLSKQISKTNQNRTKKNVRFKTKIDMYRSAFIQLSAVKNGLWVKSVLFANFQCQTFLKFFSGNFFLDTTGLLAGTAVMRELRSTLTLGDSRIPTQG